MAEFFRETGTPQKVVTEMVWSVLMAIKSRRLYEDPIKPGTERSECSSLKL